MAKIGSHSKSFNQWLTTLLTAFFGVRLLRSAEHPDTGATTSEAASVPGVEGLPTGEMHQPSEAELKARGRRNVAIALAVVGFALLIYLTTFFRLAQNLSAGSAG